MQIYNNYLHIILYESKKFESKVSLLEIESKGNEKFHRIVIKRLFITFRTHKRVHRYSPFRKYTYTVQNYNNLRKEKETYFRIRNLGYSFRNSSTIVIEYRR